MSEMRTYWTTPVTTVDLTMLIAERDALRAELAAVREELDGTERKLDEWGHEVGKVYTHITGNRLSKASYVASVVIAEAEEETQRVIEEETATLRHRAERMERVMDLLRVVSVLPSPDLLTDGDWADLCDAVRDLDAAEGKA